jgi:hypothetical protein
VIDAKTNKWLVNIPLQGGDHSIATENSSGHIFVPLQAGRGGACNGCVGVYGAH